MLGQQLGWEQWHFPFWLPRTSLTLPSPTKHPSPLLDYLLSFLFICVSFWPFLPVSLRISVVWVVGYVLFVVTSSPLAQAGFELLILQASVPTVLGFQACTTTTPSLAWFLTSIPISPQVCLLLCFLSLWLSLSLCFCLSRL